MRCASRASKQALRASSWPGRRRTDPNFASEMMPEASRKSRERSTRALREGRGDEAPSNGEFPMKAFRHSICLFFFISCLGWIVPGVLAQQPSQSTRYASRATIESYLLDVPWAEFRLEVSDRGGLYQFCNRTSQDIVEARLGCVTFRDGCLVVIKEHSRPLGRIAAVRARAADDRGYSAEARTEVTCRPYIMYEQPEPFVVCAQGKLAIVFVKLADGTEWQLTPHKVSSNK